MMLVSGSCDKSARIWRVSDGAQIDSLTGIARDVLSVDWNEDGTRLVCGMDSGRVMAWRMKKDGRGEEEPYLVIGS